METSFWRTGSFICIKKVIQILYFNITFENYIILMQQYMKAIYFFFPVINSRNKIIKKNYQATNVSTKKREKVKNKIILILMMTW